MWPLLKTHNSATNVPNWPPHLSTHSNSITVTFWLSPDITEHISYQWFASSPLFILVKFIGYFNHELTFSLILHNRKQTDKFSNLSYDSTYTKPFHFKFSRPMTTKFAPLPSKWNVYSPSHTNLLVISTSHALKLIIVFMYCLCFIQFRYFHRMFQLLRHHSSFLCQLISFLHPETFFSRSLLPAVWQLYPNDIIDSDTSSFDTSIACSNCCAITARFYVNLSVFYTQKHSFPDPCFQQFDNFIPTI